MTYHPPRAFDDLARAAATRSGSRTVTREIGSTVGGAPIPAYTVAGPGRTPDRARPQVVVIAAIHGCEVIASELALALLESVADDTEESRVVTEVADLTIVPAVNLDSRALALRSLRRRGLFVSAPRSNANGVDLNRNFPPPEGVTDHWLPLSGTTWRSPWYRGSTPLSEPETRALDSLVDELRPLALLNLHSTGNILTHPWGSRPEPPADQEAFTAMIEAFTAHQRSVRYRSKQSAAWYPSIGSSNDYFYDRYGTLAMTVETSPPAGSVKADWRRARRFFWYANPTDPEWWIDNDRAACFAALRAAVDHRGSV